MHPAKHPIARAHDRIANPLEHAIGPTNHCRKACVGSCAKKAIPCFRSGRDRKKGGHGRSRKQGLVGHSVLHDILSATMMVRPNLASGEEIFPGW